MYLINYIPMNSLQLELRKSGGFWVIDEHTGSVDFDTLLASTSLTETKLKCLISFE